MADCSLINAPKTYPCLVSVPEICECYLIWQNQTVNVIKDLELERLSCVMQVGPKCHHKYP